MKIGLCVLRKHQPVPVWLGAYICGVILGLVLIGCRGPQPEPETATIAHVKSIDPARVDKRVLEREYTVEGYYVDETVPMLVTDPKLLQINRPLPESTFVLLAGKGADGFRGKPEAYGSYVRVRGTIQAKVLIEGMPPEIHLVCPDFPLVLQKSEYTKPSVYDICKKYPAICRIRWRFPQKFALLYSGGINSWSAYTRYWNDLKFMYLTLRNQYGFTDSNIVVVYKNGTGEDTDIPVDFAASPTGLNSAIVHLRSAMKPADDFFVFVTNHGGGYHQGHGGNEGGRADGAPGDEIDSFGYDEATYYYGQTTNDVWDDDFSNWINSLNFHRMIAVFEQCFSGGFLHDLKSCNRVLISAASEFEYSWGGGPGNHDMFSYHFTCAINQADHAGAALGTNPDTNGDGKVSMLEAFLYAKANDTKSETPYLEDSGDGVGSNSPAASGTDGKLANKLTL
jgi:hypothetical protein